MEKTAKSRSALVILCAAIVLFFGVAGSLWFFLGFSNRHWAREEAVPQITDLFAAKKSLAAFNLLEKAQRYLPYDPALKQIADQNTVVATITSSPSGATVEIQDYLAPDSPWRSLGATPLNTVRLPKGFFRWKVSKPGVGELVVGSETRTKMDFALDAWLSSPPGMVPVPAGKFLDAFAFVGWIGPYNLPRYYVDRYEVTNRDYQKFVDSGGYEKKEYWPEKFTKDGHDLSWSEAMAEFRDTTGRAGPSTWVAGHYPEGKRIFLSRG